MFTLPAELRPLARHSPRLVYDLLFRAASRVLTGLARDRWHARLGATGVLHTWTRDLRFHPHVHFVVTAGGLDEDDSRWHDKTRYLFPVRKLKADFAAEVHEQLWQLRSDGQLRLPEEQTSRDSAAWHSLLRRLPKWRRWVVYVEPPFGRSTHVLQYLGRYTHRVAISDARVVSLVEDAITFRTRDDNQISLAPHEFLRRFLQHVLPRGFHKIRHFGLYASGARERLDRARDLLPQPDPLDTTADPDDGWSDLLQTLTGEDPLQCPRCAVGRLQLVDPIMRPPRAPP